jgi:acetyl-CoA C-acetyltransferase
MAMVAVKNHSNANLNPKAHLHKLVTVAEVLASKVIAWPIKMYDCSLITDGASCAIITRPELAKKFTDTPVQIIGSGQASDTIGLYERQSLTSVLAAKLAAKTAYEMANVQPKDVNVAEVHDCFTNVELMAYEDLGFCPPGESGHLIENGDTKIGGKLPVNTSGGLKAKGHPVGATGIAQTYEIYLQLTDQAGKRQVKDAKIGLSHNIGGSGATAAVHIYRSDM